MIKAITRIEAIIAILIFLSGQSWGAVTYYVRPGGNAACNGLYDTDGSSGNCAFAAIDTAWTTAAGVNDDINVYVRGGSEGSPVTYAVGAVIGGADTGNTINVYFNPYIIVKVLANTQTYVFRVAETNTTVNFHGQPGWPKTVEWDVGLDNSGAANVNIPMVFSNQSGTVIRLYDLDYNAVGASSTARMFITTSAVTSVGVYQSYIHHFDTGQSSILGVASAVILEANYFEDCDPVKNIPNYNFRAANNTFYDNAGTSNQTGITITGSGTGAHTIDVRNNLFVSNVAAGTLYGPINIAAEEFRSFGGTLTVENNAAWKNTMPTTAVRLQNNYPYVVSQAFAGADPDYWPDVYTNLLVVDPAVATLPEINSTSLMIGRGAAAGVTAGINSVDYPSDSIGCWAVAGGKKQYLSPVSNKILIAGHSYTDNTGGNKKWPDHLYDVLGARGYTLVGNPVSPTCGPTSTNPCWAQFSGAMMYRIAGAYTELAQYHAPEFIIMNGDAAAWRLYGTAWSNTLEENTIKATITNIKSLYREGDVKVIWLGSPPDDASANSSTRADEIEADMAAWISTQNYVYAGNMLARYKAANPSAWGTTYFSDSVHPSPTGCAFIANWLAPIITSKPHGAYKKRGFMFGF